MDINEYRQRGKELVDYIADYLETIKDRSVFPDVEPGYLKELLPMSPPQEPEPWDRILEDFDKHVMLGVTHWQSPRMHAYFPALNSFPSMLGDMLADALNCISFTWASCPASTELETVVMDWLAKLLGLPDFFQHSYGKGGGVIQTTASESTLISLLAGRTEAIRRFKETNPDKHLEDSEINSKLVAYCSDQAHSSVEKAGLIGLVRMRYIESDSNLSMMGEKLVEEINKDRKNGLIPFFLCATLGTTGACAFDDLSELGPICQEEGMWLHVDAAYAGTAFLCPEFRTFLCGIQWASSFTFNPSKWMMVHFDCTALWVRNSSALHRTFNVDPLYLQHEKTGKAIDFMHWQIPLSRRFRSLKLWCVIRNYGISGLQEHVRKGVRLGKVLEHLISSDDRFEIPAKRHLGLIVFRLKGENILTEKLLKHLNHRRNIHCVPASLKGQYVIRFTITSALTTTEDILKDWQEITTSASSILEEFNKTRPKMRVPLKDTKESYFSTSLLLANSPLSPKVVNGSFIAVSGDKGVSSGMTTRWAILRNHVLEKQELCMLEGIGDRKTDKFEQKEKLQLGNDVQNSNMKQSIQI